MPCLMQLLTRLHVFYTPIFRTQKDASLEIKSIALNNCFSYRNVFKWRQLFVKKLFLKQGVCVGEIV